MGDCSGIQSCSCAQPVAVTQLSIRTTVMVLSGFLPLAKKPSIEKNKCEFDSLYDTSKTKIVFNRNPKAIHRNR